jgi:putative phosphoribosyl transferase
MQLPYRDRRHAGRTLAEALGHYRERNDLLVLGLPRGGVPVAFEIANALEGDLDVLIVRKLGVPGHKELAMGAVARGGVRVLNDEIVGQLGIPNETIEDVVKREQIEIERRENAYRGNRPAPVMRGRSIIVVDDGLATGSTMAAAVRALRQHEPQSIAVAVPVAPEQSVTALRDECDEIICPATPPRFRAIGQWYDDFEQTKDDEVRELLAQAGTFSNRQRFR